MLAPTSSETKTAGKFKKKLRLPASGGTPRLLRLRKCPQTKKTLGEAVFIPEHDLIHVFDNDTLLAVSHAIEDLASEVGAGELIATFQAFENFLPSRKRYAGLARDLDAVRVWGSGPVPKGCPGVDFIQSENARLMRYWLVLFEGPSDHAVLVCKQLNNAIETDKRKFVGFYSFCPYLVQSIRWRFNLVSSGLNKVVKHFEDSFSLPDVKMSDLSPFLTVQSPAARTGSAPAPKPRKAASKSAPAKRSVKPARAKAVKAVKTAKRVLKPAKRSRK